MDNNKKDPSSIVDDLMKDIMKKLDLPDHKESASSELGADEQAIASAGLIHPDDVALEQIIEETKSEAWNTEPVPQVSDETRQFTAPPVQQTPVDEAPAFSVPEDDAAGDDPQENTTLIESEYVEESTDNDTSDPGNGNKKKSRPKSKKGYGLFGIPHIISTVIWLVLIVAIGVSLGRTAWLCAKDLLALGKDSITASITITPDDTVDDVAQKLKDAGLIEYPKLFTFFTDLTGKCDRMLTGTIHFNADDPDNPDEPKKVYDYNALANALTYRSAARVTVDVLIPEGYNCAQIFALLEEKGVCKAAELEEYAASVSKDNPELYAAINGALEELIADGTVAEIVAKYIPA